MYQSIEKGMNNIYCTAQRLTNNTFCNNNQATLGIIVKN